MVQYRVCHRERVYIVDVDVAGLSVAIVLIIAFTIGLAVLCVGLIFIRRYMYIQYHRINLLDIQDRNQNFLRGDVFSRPFPSSP